MANSPLWFVGSTRSGKTTRLVEQFAAWMPAVSSLASQAVPGLPSKTLLVFAANGDNRVELADRLTAATQGAYVIDSTTPLGFMGREVALFWPLLVQALDLPAQFPLQLRSENEQELATRLWQAALAQSNQATRSFGAQLGQAAIVRSLLDIFQLAALGTIPLEKIPQRLAQANLGAALNPFLDLGEEASREHSPQDWHWLIPLLTQWRDWCLQRGFLTYGLTADLYWRHLLPHPIYQHHLLQRYQGVLADDVDEYPAIARLWFDWFLDQDLLAAFTYHPDGKLRLGLGAAPETLAQLSQRCEVRLLTHQPQTCWGDDWGPSITDWIRDPFQLPTLPDTIRVIQTGSRAQLLRQTAETIAEAVQAQQVRPEEVVVLGPGLDAIARYTLTTILDSRKIPVRLLNTQQPLINAPIVRALLTLLALVHPHLGRLLSREAVAEMLVLLSPRPEPWQVGYQLTVAQSHIQSQSGRSLPYVYQIDPVRAGLLADYCFEPHPHHPALLPLQQLPRWDRLGHQAAQAYDLIHQWVETQKHQAAASEKSAAELFDQAIQQFLFGGTHLPDADRVAIRELLETSQHYWAIARRLGDRPPDSQDSPTTTAYHFIQLLQTGTLTADPYPARPLNPDAVTLSTVFQYRSARAAHRWQFWLDVGSSRWLTGEQALFGADALQSPEALPNSDPEAARDIGRDIDRDINQEADRGEQRLQRHILDLCGRAIDRIYLCHSDLDTSGQEQMGPLLAWVNAAGQTATNTPPAASLTGI